MAPQIGLKAYRAVQSESVAHGGKGAELVVMLYDGIIESLALATGHLERKEFREAGRQFARVFTIIAGLRETLDFEQGQPVAGNLLSFYNALTTKVMQAQTQRNLDALRAAIELVKSVRDAWQQLASPAAAPRAGLTRDTFGFNQTAVAPTGAAVAAAI